MLLGQPQIVDGSFRIVVLVVRGPDPEGRLREALVETGQQAMNVRTLIGGLVDQTLERDAGDLDALDDIVDQLSQLLRSLRAGPALLRRSPRELAGPGLQVAE